MNALSSGANGKPFFSYRVAFCVEHSPYNWIISKLWDLAIHSIRKFSENVTCLHITHIPANSPGFPGSLQVFHAPINVKLLGGGRPGIGGTFELSWEFLFKCLTPGHLWIVKIATKIQWNVARKAIKTIKSPHYGTMTTVKSPTYAQPPPSCLTLIGT